MSWDKTWMRRAFDRAAERYDRLAYLQRRVGERLLAELPRLPPPGWLVDIGAGTGWCAQALARRYPKRSLLLVDIAEGMLRQARCRLAGEASFLVGDAEALPLAEACAGLIVTNLVLQWCPDPVQALAEMQRILCPGGMLLVSTFASGTLEELRQAWMKVDSYTHVNRFVTSEFLAASLNRVGFSRWHLAQETIVQRYPSLLDLLKEIKGIGAHNVTFGRPRHLLGKQSFKALLAAYPARSSGDIEATFVSLFGWAVK